jgi:hypothetical protein
MSVDELLTMSRQELDRLEMMRAIQDRRLTQEEAAQSLRFNVPRVKRLCRACCQMGAAWLPEPAGAAAGRTNSSDRVPAAGPTRV